MRPPSLGSLPARLIAELAHASSALPDLTAIRSEEINVAPDDLFQPLRHELSAHYVALHDPCSFIGRAGFEANVLAAFEAEPSSFPNPSQRDFPDRLAALNQAITAGTAGWRTGFVKLGDDRMGNQVYFPHVSAVPGQIERLRLFLAERGDDPPPFTAAVAMALLLNCHPFTDGNGRTARVLFNHLLHRAGMPRDTYLPLYEIARRSDGGYEIALRIAEIRCDWEPFLRFILNAIRCYREIGIAAGEAHDMKPDSFRA